MNIVRKLPITFALLLLLVSFHAGAANLYTYTNAGVSGAWDTAGTWTTDPTGATLTGSAVPGNNDVVTILNGFRVFLTANVTASNLSVVINNGGVLDLSSFTLPTINVLSGSGTLKIGAGYFPTVTTNSFLSSAAAGATVEYYDFTGSIPASAFPNLTFSNSTGADHLMAFANTSARTFSIHGNLTTGVTGSGLLTVRMGSQATHVLDLTIVGNLIVGANTTFGAGIFNAIHLLNVESNITNNGLMQFSNSGQYSASGNGAIHLTFTGATDRTFACNGPTNLYTLRINKGSGSVNTLSVTSTNVNNLTFLSNAQLFTILNGTLRLGANISIPRFQGTGTANYDLGSTSLSPMLWVDGASVNTGGAALVAYGKFRITAGSFTSLGGQGTVIREEGQYLIEGGVFTTEKFRPSSTSATHRGTFMMTGGTFNAVGTAGSDLNYARFSLPYPEQVFIMSGGTLNIRNSQTSRGSLHIGSNAASHNITGGTINVILSGNSSAAWPLLSTAPLWNLTISREFTTNTATTVTLANIGSIAGAQNTAQPLVVQNDFTIDGDDNPIFNSGNLDVTVGGDFVISNGSTYTPGTNVTLFNGQADQIFNMSGTVTSGLYDWTIDKSIGTLTLSGSASSVVVRQTLSLYDGILNDGGKTIDSRAGIHNSAVHTGSGNITLSGSAAQTISGDGSGVFGNVVLDNNSLPGATLSANVSISGTLTLAGTGNSLFDIGSYQLWLTSPSTASLLTTGAGFSSSKMIRTLGLQSDQGLRKTFGNLSAFTFHFGSGTDYTPATLQLTAAPAAYGSLSVKPVNNRHPFVAASNINNLSYYWKVVSNGFAGLVPGSVNHTYRYTPAMVSIPGDDANYIPARYNAAEWTEINDLTQVNEGSQLIFFTGVNYLDGDFTAGTPSAFDIIKIFYSIRNGVWEDANFATTPWSNESHSGAPAATLPGPSDLVNIGDGAVFNHTITVESNAQGAGGLVVSAGSTLDLRSTTGHDFGRLENVSISGSGTLRISSATAVAEFPAGDFGLFIREGGGTVEYYSTGTQNFTIPGNSIAPTNLPLITYRYLVLSPGTGRTITLPDQDLLVFEELTVQGQASTGQVYLNSLAARTMTVEGDLRITSGNLQFRNGSPQTLVVDGNLSIGVGAGFDVSASGVAAGNELVLFGSFINNGSLDLSKGSWFCNTTFTGPSNASVTGTGVVTDFNVLRVSKGNSQATVLNVNATSFSLSGGNLPLVLETGTFRLSSTQTVTIANGSIFNIPTGTRLSANGGTLQVTGTNGVDMRVAGTLEVLSGAINVGTTAHDNSIEYAATGTPAINITAGNLNVNSQIRRTTASSQGALIYNQSGGIVSVGANGPTAATRGVFEILNPASSFTMSGGILRIIRPTGSTSVADLYLQPASFSISGGTIAVGTGTSARTIDINTTIPLFNLAVEGSSNVGRLEANALVLRGSLAIGVNNVFQANSLNVSIAGNLTNTNASGSTGVTQGGFWPGSAAQTTTFNGSASHQTITGSSGNITNFGNLVIANTFPGGTVTLQTDTQLRVNGNINLSSGTFADNGNTITVIGNVTNSSTHTSPSSGGIVLAGATNTLVGGNGLGKFGNLTLNNSAGASFTANQEIAGVLTLTSGSIFINQHTLYISNTSLSAIVGAGAARYIVTSGQLSNGGLRKAFASSLTNGNFVYPIGVAGKYTPADYTLTTGVLGGTITVKPVNSKHPGATGAGTSYINFYWNVTNSVITLTSVTHTYTYVASDAAGTVSEYRDAHFRAGAWNIGSSAGNPDPITRVITFTNTDVLGDYTAGEPTAFVNPTIYISVTSGDWESDDSVWDQDPPGTNLGPPAGSFVVVSPGHIITITTNTKRPATLDVQGRLHLGNTTGHDFGIVSATGAADRTIQIQSSTFPSGDFSNFMAAGGGTVEYDGGLTMSTQSVYNNVVFTGPGTKILPNADLSLNGNLTILGGTVNNTVYNRSVVLASGAGDFTNHAVFNGGSGIVILGRHLINNGAGASFTSPSGGPLGLSIGGDLTNNSSAVFAGGADAITVTGDIANSATFQTGDGDLTVGGLINNSGTFTSGVGSITATGSLINSGSYAAGAGAISVGGAFTNSGGSANYNANANSLSVAGGFNNLAGAVFQAGSGSIFLQGDWTNSANFNAGTGLVNFAGASARTATGATTFYNVTKSNGGSLTLNNSASVGGALVLTSGNIVTGSNVLELTNTAAQPVTGHGVSSFIDGRLSIRYPNLSGASRIFPVGKGTVYRPVAIRQNAASVAPVLEVEMINSPPGGSYPTTIDGLSEARYFSVNLTSGTINSPAIELSFNTNGPADENISIPGNVRVVRSVSPGGPWSDEGGSGVFSPAAPAGYTISDITTIVNPTYFALGYLSIPLPITLASFAATYSEGFVELRWTTFTESNNSYFTVERSREGIRFDSLFAVVGAGNSRIPLHYSGYDEKPFRGNSYYRLKQTDYDGTFSYSKVVRVENPEIGKPYITLYPNPSTGTSDVFLKVTDSSHNRGYVTIASIAGRIYFEGLVDLEVPLNILSVIGDRPAKGVYIVVVRSLGLTEVERLIIH